jgi:hypothetical protein
MGKAKVFYEQANAQGVVQSAGHKAVKVQCPKSRKRGRGNVKVSA